MDVQELQFEINTLKVKRVNLSEIFKNEDINIGASTMESFIRIETGCYQTDIKNILKLVDVKTEERIDYLEGKMNQIEKVLRSIDNEDILEQFEVTG